MPENFRLLAVFPHPDDETFGLGGAVPMLAAQGVQVDLICATLGERGWIGDPADDPGLEAMARIREPELRCAAGHLGIHEIFLLGCIDGEVELADPRGTAARIAAIIRQTRPHVVITFSPDGVYGHPDHIALTQFTAAAVLQAASSGDGGHPAHVVPKFYYVVDTTTLVDALQELVGGVSMEVNGVERRHLGWPEWSVTARLDTAAYFEPFWQAALCHRSQLPGYGPLVDLPEATLRLLFRYTNFVRVYSLVNGGPALETDLFEGLR